MRLYEIARRHLWLPKRDANGSAPSYDSGMPQPPDCITQALDNWMDRVQDANLDVHLELLTDDQQEDLYNTVRKLFSA